MEISVAITVVKMRVILYLLLVIKAQLNTSSKIQVKIILNVEHVPKQPP